MKIFSLTIMTLAISLNLAQANSTQPLETELVDLADVELELQRDIKAADIFFQSSPIFKDPFYNHLNSRGKSVICRTSYDGMTPQEQNKRISKGSTIKVGEFQKHTGSYLTEDFMFVLSYEEGNFKAKINANCYVFQSFKDISAGIEIDRSISLGDLLEEIDNSYLKLK